MQSFMVNMGLGLSFLALAVFRITLGISISTDWMIGLSVGAMLFSVSDLMQFFADMPKDENEQENKEVSDKNENTIAGLVMCAIFSMIFVPISGLLETLPKFIYDRLGDSATLFGLGFVIFQISLKSAFQIGQDKRKMRKESEELKRENNALRQKIVSSHLDIGDGYTEAAPTLSDENT